MPRKTGSKDKKPRKRGREFHGKTENMGRPFQLEERPRSRTCSLTDSEYSEIKSLGKGSLTKGIRRLREYFFKKGGE